MTDKHFFKKTLVKLLDISEKDITIIQENAETQDYSIKKIIKKDFFKELEKELFKEYLGQGLKKISRDKYGSMIFRDKERNQTIITLTPALVEGDADLLATSHYLKFD